MATVRTSEMGAIINVGVIFCGVTLLRQFYCCWM